MIEKTAWPLNFPFFAVANKASTSPSAVVTEPSFEEAMQRLEGIVDAMESGDTPLADLLAKFEEGSKLLAVCEQRLKAAELKIEQLKRQKDGSLAIDSFPHDRPGA